MISNIVGLVKINTIKSIFVLASLFCIFLQVNLLRTYSEQIILEIAQLPITQPPSVRSFTTETITAALPPSPNAKGGEKIEETGNTIESKNDPKIAEKLIVENENNIVDDKVLQVSVPFDNNMGQDSIQRALVVICMGNSTENSNHVERFVWSARNVGKFDGWIVLLTDAPVGRYAYLESDWTNSNHGKIAILRPEEEHFIRHFSNAPAMAYKHFKTYALQYLSKDPRLDEVSLVYYLDVDIVFGNPVWPLFHDLEQEYEIGSHSTTATASTSNSSSVAKMWLFEGNGDSQIQGGQIILDRTTSQPCLDRLRSLIDPETATRDQALLTRMLDDQNKAKLANDYSSLKCEIIIMPQMEKYIKFPSKEHMRTVVKLEINDDRPIPILNHIKNTGNDLRDSSPEDLEKYLRYIFRFKDDQTDVLGITTRTFLDASTKSKNERDATQSKNEHDATQSKRKKKKEKIKTVDSVDYKWYENERQAASACMNDDNGLAFQSNKDEDNIERAMFVISMGEKAAKMKTIERFIYSARGIGNYSGWIVVLTDAPPGRYDSINNWTDNVIVMEPKEGDVKDHYKSSNMIYKRFKTMAIEYMDRDPRLDRVELVYYLDADIVFGNDMGKAFRCMESSYGIGRLGANSTNAISLGKGKMWMFEGNSKKWHIQGGQMILDRYKSQPCLERWRKGFDDEETAKMGKDQYLLMDIKAEMDEAMNATLHQSHSSNQTTLECEIVTMVQQPYIEFPTVGKIRLRSKRLKQKGKSEIFDYSPMVHVRNDGGTGNMKDSNIRPFMTNLLRFKKGQKDTLGILKKVRMDTSATD